MPSPCIPYSSLLLSIDCLTCEQARREVRDLETGQTIFLAMAIGTAWWNGPIRARGVQPEAVKQTLRRAGTGHTDDRIERTTFNTAESGRRRFSL